jgi:hypothetical protein
MPSLIAKTRTERQRSSKRYLYAAYGGRANLRANEKAPESFRNQGLAHLVAWGWIE